MQLNFIKFDNLGFVLTLLKTYLLISVGLLYAVASASATQVDAMVEQIIENEENLWQWSCNGIVGWIRYISLEGSLFLRPEFLEDMNNRLMANDILNFRDYCNFNEALV